MEHTTLLEISCCGSILYVWLRNKKIIFLLRTRDLDIEDINSLQAGEFFKFLLSPAYFFKMNFSKKIFQEH